MKVCREHEAPCLDQRPGRKNGQCYYCKNPREWEALQGEHADE